MIEIDTEHPAIRLHLAPYERWASEFHWTGSCVRVDGAFYRDGVDHCRSLSVGRLSPTARASIWLGIDELAAVSTPEDVVMVRTAPEIDGASTHEWAVSQLPDRFAQLLSRVDPDRTFESPTLPPVRSPSAHAEVRERSVSRVEHGRAVVDRMDPPVEALIPIETSHRVLAVEPIERVRERGEPTDATVWAQYRGSITSWRMSRRASDLGEAYGGASQAA